MQRRRTRWLRRLAACLGILIVVYLAVAYFVLPRLWTHYEHRAGLAGRPMLTVTADGIPGDPLNVGLVGSEEEAIRALTAAGWHPADPVSLRTSIEIAGSVVLDRPYADAPVSELFYDGRRQLFAFEKAVGNSADRRHHVRFWQVLEKGGDGRPILLGSATFDRGAGFSHYTGEITHHIAPDIDAERDFLIGDLSGAGVVDQVFEVTGVGLTLFGRNGGGDAYYTDGELAVAVLNPGAEASDIPPEVLPNPPSVAAKNALWRRAKELLDARGD